MSRTQTNDDTDDEKHVIKCTQCSYRQTTDTKVHAYALGRKHYHGQGHPVAYHTETGE